MGTFIHMYKKCVSDVVAASHIKKELLGTTSAKNDTIIIISIKYRHPSAHWIAYVFVVWLTSCVLVGPCGIIITFNWIKGEWRVKPSIYPCTLKKWSNPLTQLFNIVAIDIILQSHDFFMKLTKASSQNVLLICCSFRGKCIAHKFKNFMWLNKKHNNEPL